MSMNVHTAAHTAHTEVECNGAMHLLLHPQEPRIGVLTDVTTCCRSSNTAFIACATPIQVVSSAAHTAILSAGLRARDGGGEGKHAQQHERARGASQASGGVHEAERGDDDDRYGVERRLDHARVGGVREAIGVDPAPHLSEKLSEQR